MLDFEVFRVLIFKDRACAIALYAVKVVSKIFDVTNFAVSHRSAETAKINTLENFPLYGTLLTVCIHVSVLNFFPSIQS